MPLHNLTRFPRLEFIGAPTPLEYLPRFSDYLGREIFIKRDEVTPMAMGGNKLRKLEFLAADALREGADTLITAGAIQSNHVRQTAAVAAKLGLHCVALLENPIGTTAENYLTNGNRLLLDLFNTQIEMCDALTDPNAQLEELATRVEAQGFRPYVIPVGGSNALGALGYVESALEIAQQCEGAVNISSVVVASGSAGTHAGLAVGLEHLMPESELIGVTVSRSVADQLPKVVNLQQAIAKELELTASAEILLWDDYFASGYGVPNDEGMEAVKLLARLEGILLDPVYTGKAMAGLIDGISQKRFKDEGPILFIHTGGMFFGLLLGFILALMRLSPIWPVRWLARFYISIFRGTPLIAQLFMIYYGLPQFGIELDPIPSAMIGLSLNTAAYAAETLRAAISSIDKGQWEAAASIGMTPWQTMRRAILPQAARVALPPLSNSFISLVKDTSLAATIQVPELFRQAQLITSRTLEVFTMYLAASLIYWIMATVLSTLQNHFENQLNRQEREPK
ncbi:TPA: D-cysteine desulfhydrase [Shigella flexneri]|nr:D-cysteine desulfhydrase [Shigella flexneri]